MIFSHENKPRKIFKVVKSIGYMSDDTSKMETPAENMQEPATPTTELPSNGIIDEAKKVAERIEKANLETARLLKEKERLMVEQTLQGRTFAGQQKPAEPTIKDKAADFFGSGPVAEAIRKHG